MMALNVAPGEAARREAERYILASDLVDLFAQAWSQGWWTDVPFHARARLAWALRTTGNEHAWEELTEGCQEDLL